MRDLTERTLASKRVFEGRALTIDVLDIEMPDGRKTTREVVRHRGAVAILGEVPDGRFVFVRQYRKAVEDTLLEVVAGCLEPGEEPESAARREMEEESGYVVQELRKLGTIVCTPGYCEEHLHLYHARLSERPHELSPDFDENLEPLLMTAAEIDAAIASGALYDAKSICAWHYWTRRK